MLPALHAVQPFPGASINTPLPGMRNSTATKRLRKHGRHASVDRVPPKSPSMHSSTSATPLSRSRVRSARDGDSSVSSAGDRLDVDVLLGAQLQPAPRRAAPHSPSPTGRDRVLEQVDALAALIKSMPGNLVETVLEQLELNEAMRRQNDSRKDALIKKEKEEALRMSESKLERRNQALAEMLDAAERRAEARELRLQAMLAEVSFEATVGG